MTSWEYSRAARKQVQTLGSDLPPNISGGPIDDTLRTYIFDICGPPFFPYEGIPFPPYPRAGCIAMAQELTMGAELIIVPCTARLRLGSERRNSNHMTHHTAKCWQFDILIGHYWWDAHHSCRFCELASFARSYECVCGHTQFSFIFGGTESSPRSTYNSVVLLHVWLDRLLIRCPQYRDSGVV